MMKTININAPVRCSKQIEINAPIEKVWKIMIDIDNWSQWQDDITKPRLLSELTVGAKFKWRTGGAGITSILHTVNQNTELGWTGKTYGMYAIHNWTFKKTPTGTLVSVDESMQGFFASLFKNIFNKNLERDMSNWLICLKRVSEKR